ncbi:MerR family transcriptional regulator [Pseudonocardia endophytica]|uniref:DNA-binding transcriptional MerR regulator n=1 Tax=Pseudonocardia endophytica TaxID=401976 RepID=A0A4V2PHC9_PSEEN|nr:MerR family transcriptional regulator [Pseudonocardia endophytica]TCK20266.1 DNA-binding transcriptional MerR regulator [Pseudonocardia endophytica]
MAWSTRQIAELAGTSVRAVRHYHEVGLLAEPERRSNGYKQYGVAHLVRVLRIKRLTDLGFSLGQIAELGDADEHPEQELRKLDTELAETIERLEGVRAELAEILRESTPTDLPADLAPTRARSELSEADRAFLVVAGRVLGPQGLKTYAEMLQTYENGPEMKDFDDLPEDADEATRQALAERLAPAMREIVVEYPALADLHADAPRGARHAQKTFGLALRDLYNPAQLDVMIRTEKLNQAVARDENAARKRS